MPLPTLTGSNILNLINICLHEYVREILALGGFDYKKPQDVFDEEIRVDSRGFPRYGSRVASAPEGWFCGNKVDNDFDFPPSNNGQDRVAMRSLREDWGRVKPELKAERLRSFHPDPDQRYEIPKIARPIFNFVTARVVEAGLEPSNSHLSGLGFREISLF